MKKSTHNSSPHSPLLSLKLPSAITSNFSLFMRQVGETGELLILFLGQAKNGVSLKKEDKERESRVEIYKSLLRAGMCEGSAFYERMLRGISMINGATGMLCVV